MSITCLRTPLLGLKTFAALLCLCVCAVYLTQVLTLAEQALLPTEPLLQTPLLKLFYFYHLFQGDL